LRGSFLIFLTLLLFTIELSEINQIFAEENEKTSEKEWSERDILISSSTIFAFFGFGAFFVTRFDNTAHLSFLLLFLGLALFFIALIEVFQIAIILSVVTNSFDVDFYVLIMILTVTFFCFILFLVWIIVAIDSTAKPLTEVEKRATKSMFTALGIKL